MLHGVITFLTGLLVVLAIGMFGACLVLKLREFGFDLLRELSKVRNRPWFERALLLFFICGMVQYAATKGRLRYFKEIESGDSGDPKFLLFGNSAILVCTLHVYGTGKSGAGPFLTSWADKLQEVLDRVSDENSVPRRQLNYFDFSNYEKITDE